MCDIYISHSGGHPQTVELARERLQREDSVSDTTRGIGMNLNSLAPNNHLSFEPLVRPIVSAPAEAVATARVIALGRTALLFQGYPPVVSLSVLSFVRSSLSFSTSSLIAFSS